MTEPRIIIYLIKYDRMYFSKELVGIMNDDEAEKYIKNNQERTVSYEMIPLNDFEERKLNEIGKEKLEQIIRNRMNDFYIPYEYRD